MKILITGGAGSLGTALVSELQKEESNKIRVLDNNEHALATMNIPYPSEVRKLHGSITDKDRVRRAVDGVDLVIHCAAMKNLDITEYNVSELIKTNVVGTDNVISLSVESGVQKIMFISSDKAVEPTSIYGASKLIGEHTALNYNQTSYPLSKVSIFRSGNFMNSNGNVFESWKYQLENGFPLKITDPKCRRYYIDTNTAARTILKCIAKMEGGEIFIPNDMIMKEISILNLAKDYICKSHTPPIPKTKFNTENLKFDFIGLRNGEKLSENLFNSDEIIRKTNDTELNCWIISDNK